MRRPLLVKTICTSVQYPCTWSPAQGSEVFLCGSPELPVCLSEMHIPGLHSGLGSDAQHHHSLAVGLEGCWVLLSSPVKQGYTSLGRCAEQCIHKGRWPHRAQLMEVVQYVSPATDSTNLCQSVALLRQRLRS